MLLSANVFRCASALLMIYIILMHSKYSYAKPIVGEDSQYQGIVCVKASEKGTKIYIDSLRSKNISALRGGFDVDNYCDTDASAEGRRNDYRSISLPMGLESAAMSELQRLGATVKKGIATAGGSGDMRRLIDKDELSPTPVSDDTLAAAKANMECKLKSEALKYFKYVSIYKCKGEDFANGLCWDVRVLGHTASSRGLNPHELSDVLSDRYWVRVYMRLYMGYFDGVFSKGALDRSKLQVIMMVDRSEYARAPEDKIPEIGRFRSISEFEHSISVDDLDTMLGNNIADKFFGKKLVCEP